METKREACPEHWPCGVTQRTGSASDCLSRMRGNSPVRFLGEGVAARPPPYPTCDASRIGAWPTRYAESESHRSGVVKRGP